MFLSHIFSTKIADSLIFSIRLFNLSPHNYRFKRHEMQSGALKFIVVLIITVLTLFILEDEVNLLLIINSKEIFSI
jgi:hypothetical protein